MTTARAIVIATFLFCLLVRPFPVLAVEVYKEGSVIFSDDFNDGNYGGWTVESGKWIVDTGRLSAVIGGSKLVGGRITSSTSGWDNYRLELDVRNDFGIDEGIGFRYSDASNFYELTLRHAVHGLVGFEGAPDIYLRKTQQGQVTELFHTKDFLLVTKQTYKIKVEVVNEHLQLWVDGTLIFDLDDKGTTVKTGTVSLSYWTGNLGSTSVRFDNIKITSLQVLKPIYPVIFIPGIGGSELKMAEDTSWSQLDGHGGTYSRFYQKDEKVWVNQDEAIKLGDDDYFDVLRLKTDGITPEAKLSLTGNLVPYGYGEIDSFFEGMGYKKGTSFFVYPYDWRTDIRSTKEGLDKLVEEAKTKTGLSKVNIVTHSMGGLVARYYISDLEKSKNVNKLITLGTPYLGSVKALKTNLYGERLTKRFLGIFELGLFEHETKDVLANSNSAFSLHPSFAYYSFYNNSNNALPYPFFDDRDIDSNNETGALDYSKIITLLGNLKFNQLLLSTAQTFHELLLPTLSKTSDAKLYNIVGSGQPTLGQMKETWWINWPIKLIPRYEEIYIDGDETVPLYSASLKTSAQNLMPDASLYFVEQKHSDLVKPNGTAMLTVKQILLDETLPTEIKSEKIGLDGQQISLDDGELDLYDEDGNHTGINTNGELETSIPETYFDTLENSRHVFIKKKSTKKITAKITKKKTGKVNLKVKTYQQDNIVKTSVYNDVSLSLGSTAEMLITPTSLISQTTPNLSIGSQTSSPSAEVTGANISDSIPPISTIEVANNKDIVTVTITVTDSGAGILKTEYSLDNGQTIQTYTQPFIITTPGTTTILVKSTDKLGNQEYPQTVTVTINEPVTTASSNSQDFSGNLGSASVLDNLITPSILPTQPSIPFVNLGISFTPEIKTPSAILGISANLYHINDNQSKSQPNIFEDKRFTSMLLFSGLALGLLSAGLGSTFLSGSPFFPKMPK